MGGRRVHGRGHRRDGDAAGAAGRRPANMGRPAEPGRRRGCVPAADRRADRRRRGRRWWAAADRAGGRAGAVVAGPSHRGHPRRAEPRRCVPDTAAGLRTGEQDRASRGEGTRAAGRRGHSVDAHAAPQGGRLHPRGSSRSAGPSRGQPPNARGRCAGDRRRLGGLARHDRSQHRVDDDADQQGPCSRGHPLPRRAGAAAVGPHPAPTCRALRPAWSGPGGRPRRVVRRRPGRTGDRVR